MATDTTNYGWVLPAQGDGIGNAQPWGLLLNNIFNSLDTILGGVTTINLSGDVTSINSVASIQDTVVTGKTLTNYVLGAVTPIASDDTILSALGKLQAQINTVLGAVIYKGVWNASTNTPDLVSSVQPKGYYWKVSVPGTTTVSGISQWNAGDTIISDGTQYDKIDGITNENVTIGTTVILLGAISTVLAGLTSVTSSSFIGALTGNASTATSLYGGTIGAVHYQSAVGVTSFLAAGTTSQVLIGGPSNPSWSNTPTLTGTNFTAIPGTAINSVVGSATNLAGGLLGSIHYQSAVNTTATLVGPTTNGTYHLESIPTAGVAVAPIWVLATGTGAPVCAIAPTFTGGKVTLAAPTTAYASLNFINGTAPTTPSNGDMWLAGNILYYKNANIVQNLDPFTSLGDTDYGGVNGLQTRLAGPTTNGTWVLTEVVTAAAAVAPIWTQTTGLVVAGLIGGNSTTLLGSIPYQSNTNVTTLLNPNTTATKNFLSMTGTGTNGAVPVWGAITSIDLTTALLTPPAIGTTTPGLGKFTILSHTQKANFTAYTNTPALGDMWFDTTQQTFLTSEGIGANIITTAKPGVIGIAKSTAAVALAAAGTYYSILPNIIFGTLTIPIGILVVGKTILLEIVGTLNVITAASVFNIKLLIGASSYNLTATASLAIGSYDFELTAKVTLSGAPGTTAATLGLAKCSFTSTTGSVMTGFVTQSTTPTVNTTIANLVDCQFSAVTGTASTVMTKSAIATLLG